MIKYTTLLTVLLSLLVLVTSCKKEKNPASPEPGPSPTPSGPDLTSPSITLNGDSVTYVDLHSAFSDKGATANDDRDGDITAKITISGSVDTSKVGINFLTYNIKDLAGHLSTAKRKIIVRHTPATLYGSYIFSNTCGNSGFDLGLLSPNSDTKVTASNFGGFGVDVYFLVSGLTNSQITVPTQIKEFGSAEHEFSGSGYISENGKLITINFSKTANNITISCTVVYNRP